MKYSFEKKKSKIFMDIDDQNFIKTTKTAKQCKSEEVEKIKRTYRREL